MVVGTVVKAKIGELEEEVREIFLRRKRKELTRVFQGVSWKKRFLVKFQVGCEKDMTSNKFTIVILENIPVEEEPDVPTIPEIPEEKVTLDKGYYHGVYILIYFDKYGGV